MAEALSPEEQIAALRRELAQRDAIIAAREAELAEAAVVKARLTAALLEIEQIKLQLGIHLANAAVERVRRRQRRQ